VAPVKVSKEKGEKAQSGLFSMSSELGETERKTAVQTASHSYSYISFTYCMFRLL
jgi:hypothetical protein